MSRTNNIHESDLNKIIEKFCPNYHLIDDLNKEIVRDAYKKFFEESLSYSFELKKG